MVRELDPSTGTSSLFSKTIQTSPANHQTSYLIFTGFPSQGYYGWIIKLTTPNLPVPRLKRSGAILQVYARNNIIAAEQNFMKFVTGEFVKNCGAITVFFYVGWLF